ncbi:pyrroloquinoline quinone biosynthesis peptide chaperone PqqD [Halomonas caseinilytica]|uniref:Pyrroloquinoline-quinone synthase/pyrroloquinoline quinone biosynthesis protein D n=1 Tax=Halomonas caseinilytica TaxID=438744 RepID=A0A1M6SP83_9GAMM|nr:pyrroloquinoline quinone biosynthesis peptide chaperone PqqD [Halomonas caseinilytica]SHK46447.1 pyrroloquinoline-quinone synthase/pyrroloquinoline quinone biosynthesis protein D [Halomonas caseinilytica]
MTEIQESDIVRIPRGVRLREDKQRGGWVLLAPERVFQLDGIAQAVIGHVDGERRVGEIVDRLCEAYQAPRERIAEDVIAMFAGLVEKRVLEVA